jgi:DNA-binding transcriptional MerR regulator
MSPYTVSGLARLAGVSIRTLRYYDEIGLMKPSTRTEAGYRQYDQEDLLRLQQILFYRELDMPLIEIRDILEDEDFNPVEALRSHREGLLARSNRLRRLIETLNTTIEQLEEGQMRLSDDELFAAFSPEQASRYRQEAREQWGEARVKEAENRLRKLSREEWEKVQAEGGLVAKQLASLMDQPVESPNVQEAIARHHAWIENFYPAPAAVYRGLGQMYAEHPEFRAFYEQYAPGLADYMRQAMELFADSQLGE